MSKKLEVLQMLEAAGPRGVRSDEFYRRFNGRGVARIYDLRKEGYAIEDEREGKYKRYKLVGSRADDPGARGATGASAAPHAAHVCPASSEESILPAEAALERSVPSMFDADADWGEAA